MPRNFVRTTTVHAVRWLVLAGRRLCQLSGVSLFLAVLLAFSSIPFRAHRWLGVAGGLCTAPPEAILLLGGSGMPSGPELMRCNVAASMAKAHPAAHVLLVLPADTGLARSMMDELVLRGVASLRIDLLLHGRNTREQALDVAHRRPTLLPAQVALVTAPENMYRSLLTFRKLGFRKVLGAPAFDHALFDDLRYDHGRIGGGTYVPDISGSMDLRYNFWNRLKLEVTCLREYAALAYYKLNGWI